MSKLPFFTQVPTQAIIDDVYPLGLALVILSATKASALSVNAIMAWLRVPLKLGQAVFLISNDGWPLGFATWAYLESDTLNRMSSGSQDLPLLEEWNEGSHVWITDFVAPYGNSHSLAVALRDVLVEANHFKIKYRRNKRSYQFKLRVKN